MGVREAVPVRDGDAVRDDVIGGVGRAVGDGVSGGVDVGVGERELVLDTDRVVVGVVDGVDAGVADLLSDSVGVRDLLGVDGGVRDADCVGDTVVVRVAGGDNDREGERVPVVPRLGVLDGVTAAVGDADFDDERVGVTGGVCDVVVVSVDEGVIGGVSDGVSDGVLGGVCDVVAGGVAVADQLPV